MPALPSGRLKCLFIRWDSRRLARSSMPAAEQSDLFGDETPVPRSPMAAAPAHQPLAARMRPRRLSEVVGQGHILEAGSLLPRLVAQNRFGSLLFYGPPGCGESSIAEAIARE